jgi:hypothetical protein
MGAGKARVLGLARAVALGVTLLASGCARLSSSASGFAPGQTYAPATPTVTPPPAPVLGSMSYGTFPASPDGIEALTVCEQWAVLRDQYVGQIRADTPDQLEQWFSGSAWLTAVQANKPLKADPDCVHIDTAFGLVSSAAGASVPNAQMLDQACASADLAAAPRPRWTAGLGPGTSLP